MESVEDSSCLERAETSTMLVVTPGQIIHKSRGDHLSRYQSYRTKFKSCFHDVRTYTAVFCCIWFVFGMGWGTFITTITTIEKRFQFRSTQSGIILGSYEIGHLTVALFFSHFGNRFSIPKILFISTLTICLAQLMMVLPKFVKEPSARLSTSETGSADSESGELCQYGPSGRSNATDWDLQFNVNNSCSSPEFQETSTSSTAAFALFVLAFVTLGAAATPLNTLSITYLDDNTKQNESPMHLGIVSTMLGLGPTFGQLLNSYLLSLPENLGETSLTPDNPRWIGVWWLGFVIIAILFIIPGIPMLFFPRKMKPRVSRDTEIVDAGKPEETDEVYTWKSLFTTIGRLLKNPVYMCISLSGCCAIYMVGGFFSFLPKYYEIQFGIPAWRASTITGVVNGVFGSVGALVGGFITTKFKLSFRSTTIFCLTALAVTILAMISSLLFSCDEVRLSSHNGMYLDLPCSSACVCSHESFDPICDLTTGTSFFSPCVAGCQSKNITVETGINQMYGGCDCMVNSTAVSSFCPRDCASLIPYSVMVGAIVLSSSMLTAPSIYLLLRCVQKTDKALAIGMGTCIISLLGWMPSATIFGVVVDSTCNLWQTTCGKPGACWLYDIDEFRVKMHGVTVGFLLAQWLLLSLILPFSRGKNFDELKSDS